MEAHIEEVSTPTKRDRGFTLVELLIVIVILGVLATVTVFAVRGITDKGKTSACAADKKTLEVAIEAYLANGGALASITEAGLVPGFLHAEVSGYNISATGQAVAETVATVNTNGCT